RRHSVPSVLAAELKTNPTLEGIAESDLDWLAERCTLIELKQGEVLLRPGDPPDWMYFVLQGELHGIPEPHAKDGGRLYIIRAGEVTGMLPFSRMTRIPRLVTAGSD